MSLGFRCQIRRRQAHLCRPTRPLTFCKPPGVEAFLAFKDCNGGFIGRRLCRAPAPKRLLDAVSVLFLEERRTVSACTGNDTVGTFRGRSVTSDRWSSMDTSVRAPQRGTCLRARVSCSTSSTSAFCVVHPVWIQRASRLSKKGMNLIKRREIFDQYDKVTDGRTLHYEMI